jgi:hypothetical protein
METGEAFFFLIIISPLLAFVVGLLLGLSGFSSDPAQPPTTAPAPIAKRSKVVSDRGKRKEESNIMTNNTTLRAITNDGRTAVLYKDGTWKFVDVPGAPNAGSREPGFRKSLWGMSMSEVEGAEDRDDLERGDNFLWHTGRIADMPCEMYFIFAHEQLVRGRVLFTVEHSNSTAFIYDFDRIKELLGKKYGVAQSDEEIWKDDLYKDDPSEWGMAVGNGGLVKYATWSTPETSITLMLSGDNHDISLVIDYVSKNLGHLEDQAKELQALDEL